jgi:hypothetical protein
MFAHNVNFLVCSKLFTIGKSIVSLVFHEFVSVINVTFKKLIYWQVRTKMWQMMEDFKQWYFMNLLMQLMLLSRN